MHTLVQCDYKPAILVIALLGCVHKGIPPKVCQDAGTGPEGPEDGIPGTRVPLLGTGTGVEVDISPSLDDHQHLVPRPPSPEKGGGGDGLDGHVGQVAVVGEGHHSGEAPCGGGRSALGEL